MVGEGLQVLHDGGEVELVASAGKAPQPHTLETVVRLKVRKAHLYLLALVTGFDELRCTHQGARRIPCILMHVARDLSKGARPARTYDEVATTKTMIKRTEERLGVHLGLSGHGPQSRVLAR